MPIEEGSPASLLAIVLGALLGYVRNERNSGGWSCEVGVGSSGQALTHIWRPKIVVVGLVARIGERDTKPTVSTLAPTLTMLVGVMSP